MSALLLLISGCSSGQTGSHGSPTPAALPVLVTMEGSGPPEVPLPSEVFPSTEPAKGRGVVPDTGWQSLHQGLERRVINMPGAEGETTHSVYILRIDPAYYRFDVGYEPGQARSIFKWSQDTGALIAVNGGYFTEENFTTGLTVSGGVPHGSTYLGFGGMFSADENGPRLRWLQQEPFDTSESISAGLQSFPMLVTPGGSLGYSEEGDEKARRTVLAEDSDGRIFIIIIPSATFSLAELSSYLVQSDLELDMALNLDGGASTGLILSNPAEGFPAFSELPSVLLVYPK